MKKTKQKFSVILLYDYNVIEDSYTFNSKYICAFYGIFWRYFPNFTFKNRKFLIVDN